MREPETTAAPTTTGARDRAFRFAMAAALAAHALAVIVLRPCAPREQPTPPSEESFIDLEPAAAPSGNTDPTSTSTSTSTPTPTPTSTPTPTPTSTPTSTPTAASTSTSAAASLEAPGLQRPPSG